jgi:hypothetical protein
MSNKVVDDCFRAASFLKQAKEIHSKYPCRIFYSNISYLLFKNINTLIIYIIGCDGHNDLAWAVRNITPTGPIGVNDLDLTKNLTGKYFPGCRNKYLHTDIPRMREGGIGWQFWSVYTQATVTGSY